MIFDRLFNFWTPKRKGDWIITYSGEHFWPIDARPEEVHVVDIAHSLSNQCRYAGHCRIHYPIAVHTLLGLRLLKGYNNFIKFIWLNHDDTEAYVLDLPSPLKKYTNWGRMYSKNEHKLMKVIGKRFDIPHDFPQVVKDVDLAMLALEGRLLMKGDWYIKYQPYLDKFKESGFTKMTDADILSPVEAEKQWIEAFYSLSHNKNIV